ncbi:MAG: autotransporter-associated beta strand repeat-containing protein [Verrucomicrobia bacterium]|nr:autotransporter-associated beta strand repeat-containing protein [Verrucomicrobiota bacterium]
MKVPKTRLRHRTLTGLTLTALCALTAHADSNWTGATSHDWNDNTNWDSGLPGTTPGNATTWAVIFTGPSNSPVISADSLGSPVAIGIGGGSRLDQTAGLLTETASDWPGGSMLIGLYGNGTYNLANTTTTGGAFTGYGTGSGSFTTGAWGSIQVGAGWWWDHSTAVMNVNTSGTLQINGDLAVAGAKGDNSIVNIDAGTVIVNSNSKIASGSSTETSTGSLNMSGGTVTFVNRLTMGDGTRSGDGSVGNPYVYANGSNVATLTMTGGSLTTNSTHNENWHGGLSMASGYDGAVGGTATFNLNGGTLTTLYVFSETTGGGTKGTSTFNFNGGTLKASGSYGAFMEGLTRANVRNGGAIVDTNSFNVTIAQDLVHSNIGGDNAIDGGLTKQGLGTLTLTGANTFTGSIHVNAGTLSINSAFIANTASVYLLTGGTLDLNYSGSDTIVGLFIDGAAQNVGTWGSLSSSADFKSALITGNGLLNITSSAIPEPSTYAIAAGGLALVGAMVVRRRRAQSAKA